MIYDGIGTFYIDNLEKKDDKELFNHIDSYPFFEVIRIINKRPIFLREHISRLRENFEFLKYYQPPSDEELKLNLYKAIEESKIKEGNIKLCVVDDDYENRHILCFEVKQSLPSQLQYEEGVSLILTPMERENRVKLYSDIRNEEIWRSILKEGAFEGLLLNKDGKIREGSRSNIFFISDEGIITADESEIISTVNRKFIIDLIKDQGFSLEYNAMTVRELYLMRGAFLIGTQIGILPVGTIEGIKLDSKNPNIKKISEIYEEKIQEITKRREK